MSNISLQIWLGLNVLVLMWKTKRVSLLANENPLCRATNMPCEPDYPEICHMRYYNVNSTECRDLIFDGKLVSSSSSSELLGEVELKSFYYTFLSYKVSAFNITFSKINWSHLQFRFKQLDSDMKNACREFFILPNVTKSDFFFDCIWSNETYEGKSFCFEYQASNDIQKIYQMFLFKVPLAKNIDDVITHIEKWEIFMYVKMTSVLNGWGPTIFQLYWQPLPKKFLVDSYNISIISNDTGVPETVHTEIVICMNVSKCNYIYSKWYGSLQFAVQPVCTDNIKCYTTKTLFFVSSGEKTKYLLIGIICSTIFILFGLYILCILRRYILSKKILITKPPPKLLFIYSKSVSAHVKVVLALVEYFKNHCNIEPLVDELHIFLSETRDPFTWCNKSFKITDFVMVIASPFYKQRPQLTTSIYKNTDILLLRMLQERLVMTNKAKFFVLMLPYSTDSDIPCEAEHIRRFYFPRDHNKILRFIHQDRFLGSSCSSKILGNKEVYKLYGRKVISAIEEAENFLKNNELDFQLSLRNHNEEEVFNLQHKLSMFKNRRETQELRTFSVNKKEFSKKAAKEYFAEFPGPIENLNLSGKDEEI